MHPHRLYGCRGDYVCIFGSIIESSAQNDPIVAHDHVWAMPSAIRQRPTSAATVGSGTAFEAPFARRNTIVPVHAMNTSAGKHSPVTKSHFHSFRPNICCSIAVTNPLGPGSSSYLLAEHR